MGKSSDEILIEEFLKNRRALNNRINLLLKNSPIYQNRKKGIFIAIAFLSVVLIVLLMILFLILDKAPIYQLNFPRSTERIINNVTQYMQPEHTADCIKVEGEYSDSYVLSCERIK